MVHATMSAADGFNTTVTLQCGHTLRLNFYPSNRQPQVGDWYECACGDRRAVAVSSDAALPPATNHYLICSECGRQALDDQLCPIHPRAVLYAVNDGVVKR